jgi:serine-type D-Ala-D-Ala carboxypeptidase/endopeptidase (penicillin-binding protein 4)
MTQTHPRLALLVAAAGVVSLLGLGSLPATAAKPATSTATASAKAAPKAPPTKATKSAATKPAAQAVVTAKAPPVVRPVRVVQTAPTLAAPLKRSVEAALNQEGLDGAEVGFIAIDLQTGAVLAESGADRLINPASNAKMVTSAAALATLKPEFRFKTEYYVQGSLKDGVLYGNLVVRGYGDPSIVSERLLKVANELYLFGIERITGSIIVDDSYFDSQEEARGWELEEAPDRAYAAPVSALSVNHNAVAVYVRPASEPGKAAVVRVDPPTERVRLIANVTTEAIGRGIRVVSQQDKNPETGVVEGTLLTIEGSLSARSGPARVYRRVYDPTRHFGSVFVGFLQQRGIKVRHSVVKGPVPPGARLILVDRSHALREIVNDLNHYSNNIIAETLIKAMGAHVAGEPGTFDNGLSVARGYLEETVGLAPGSYVFGNGSGLNDVNRFTARQMAQLIRAVAMDYEIAGEWFTSFAVAGTQGTISHRMKDTPAKRRLRAKTGTLRGVSALSGTVATPEGQQVAFSFMAQGYKTGASPIWKAQNAVGAAFASGGTHDQKDVESDDEGEVLSLTIPGNVEPSLGGAP